jgi:hypothetical protein
MISKTGSNSENEEDNNNINNSDDESDIDDEDDFNSGDESNNSQLQRDISTNNALESKKGLLSLTSEPYGNPTGLVSSYPSSHMSGGQFFNAVNYYETLPTMNGMLVASQQQQQQHQQQQYPWMKEMPSTPLKLNTMTNSAVSGSMGVVTNSGVFYANGSTSSGVSTSSPISSSSSSSNSSSNLIMGSSVGKLETTGKLEPIGKFESNASPLLTTSTPQQQQQLHAISQMRTNGKISKSFIYI